MKIKFPLYAKILGWFFLNLVFLGVVFVVASRGQFHFGLDALISGPAGDGFQKVAQTIAEDLRDRPRNEWDSVLEHFDDIYHAHFFLFLNEDQIAGERVALPSGLRARLASRRGMPLHPPRPEPGAEPEPGEPFAPPGGGHEHPPGPPEGRRFMMHTGSPSRYWVATRTVIPEPGEGPPHGPAWLLAESESFTGGGLFFDLGSWVIAALAAVIVSVLFWLPLVRGITRAISRMTRATEKIAEGHFEVRTQVRRADELGSLSEAIDRMAMRLAGFVAGQKRFLGDIAHELCSPIARTQVALGILEQRADEKQKVYLADLREEVEQMSSLVNELLSFSKASLGGPMIKLQVVPLRAMVEKAVNRECGTGATPEIKIEVAEDLNALAEPELLLRAVSNILRNAIRYAGNAGPIVIRAAKENSRVILSIEDCGPGVPAAALAQVFDPFYRVDVSRDRETGGVGLGLSIVKTCVESCGGSVRCENREPQGLRVRLELPAVAS